MCGCCANLGQPIIGTNRWGSFKELVNFNVAERNELSRNSGTYTGIFVWTIDNPQHMDWLISEGIDGIITNKPYELVQQLVRHQRRPRHSFN